MSIIINNVELDKTNILFLISEDKKINAIKYIKDHTNIGLKECKDIVDNLEDNPSYYDGKPFEIKVILQKKEVVKRRARKGSHVINNKESQVKNYVIFALVICVAVLLYLYLKK